MKTILFFLLFACSLLSAQQPINQENTHSLGLLYDNFWIQAVYDYPDDYRFAYQSALGLNYSFRKKKMGLDMGGFFLQNLINPFGQFIENPPGSGNYILPNGDPVNSNLLSLFIKSDYYVDIKNLISVYANLGAGPDFWLNDRKGGGIQTWINAYGGTGIKVQFLKHLSLATEMYYKQVLFSTKDGENILFKNSYGFQVRLNFVIKDD